MTVLERVRAWLLTFPGMERVQQLRIDYGAPQPDNGSIAPAGLTELSRREDILGQVRVENRCSFKLYFVLAFAAEDAACVDENANWLLSLQEWVQAQSVARLAPVFGDVPQKEVMHAHDGVLEEVREEGTAVYAVELTADFIREYNNF